MQDAKKKIEEIEELRECVMKYLKCLKDSDIAVPAEEVGQWVDMMKDSFEAEKDVWKGCYYKKIVEGMEPISDEEMRKFQEKMRMQGNLEGSFGYDNWRYSSGKFAPTGHGHYAGYVPDDEMWDPDMNMMMGYSGSKNGTRINSNMPDNGNMNTGYHNRNGNDRYGRAYAEWEDSRRHYTETKSKDDKDNMDRHAKEHVKDAMFSIKEMWRNGDPELKKEIKKELTAVVADMPA